MLSGRKGRIVLVWSEASTARGEDHQIEESMHLLIIVGFFFHFGVGIWSCQSVSP
jgi:hypothetical protein